MQLTVRQIAEYLDAVVEGDHEASISDFARIEEGRPGSLTFLANEKYEPYLYTTESTAALVNNSFVPTQPIGSLTLIRVEDAYAALAKLMQLASTTTAYTHPSGVDSLAFVHPTAQIGEGCYIGAFAYIAEGVVLASGVRVYPHVYVGRDTRVGQDTIMYPHVTVYHRCSVGARCILHAGVVVGSDGFGFAPSVDGYEKIPQLGVVEVADDVEIGANACIDRASIGATCIERGVKLDNLVQIAHNCTVGEHTVMAAQVGVAGSTRIGTHCRFGGQAGIAGHVRVGDRVSLGGQTGVLGNVKDGAELLGAPGMPVRDFLRSSAVMRKLPALISRVEELEKQIDKIKTDGKAKDA